jgi:hypothetical protein
MADRIYPVNTFAIVGRVESATRNTYGQGESWKVVLQVGREDKPAVVQVTVYGSLPRWVQPGAWASATGRVSSRLGNNGNYFTDLLATIGCVAKADSPAPAPVRTIADADVLPPNNPPDPPPDQIPF